MGVSGCWVFISGRGGGAVFWRKRGTTDFRGRGWCCGGEDRFSGASPAQRISGAGAGPDGGSFPTRRRSLAEVWHRRKPAQGYVGGRVGGAHSRGGGRAGGRGDWDSADPRDGETAHGAGSVGAAPGGRRASK